MAVPASVSWAKMIPGLEGIGGRVCWYDRAGYGWSDSGPMPQTSKRNAEVLHEVLKVAEEKGPFVLVGHSYGAYTIRLFEHAYPEQVAGLVFLEPSHEDLPFRSAALNPGKNEAAWRAEFNNLSVMFGAISAFLSPFAVADRLGLAAIEAEHGGINKVRYTPRDIASVFNGKYFKAVSSELRTFMYESANQTRQTVPARPRARLPVAVLLGANEIAPFCIPRGGGAGALGAAGGFRAPRE
ncbi:Alpha/Beta hydrolase protein [Chytriomyces sp. MP71]|nr:Alpha/Beta hydrolase protein [Chytriomyces sp. MP71]